jgi:tetratricopeptide (TPR) repeat protein
MNQENLQNQPPHPFWSRPWKGRYGTLAWTAALAAGAFVVVLVLELFFGPANTMAGEAIVALVVALVLSVGGVLALRFFLWARHWRNFRRVLFGLALLVTLVALIHAEEDLRGKWAWEKFKRACEAKGEHFDLASLAPPMVPDDENFAMAPIVASSYQGSIDQDGEALALEGLQTNVVDRLAMDLGVPGSGLETPARGDWRGGKPTDLGAWQAYFRRAAAQTNEFPVPANPGAPASDVLLALSRYDSAIAELREAAKRPYSRFPLAYKPKGMPAAILLPHLAPLKSCVQTLQLRAVAELEAGQPQKALEDVKLMLRLANALREEPFLISQLVRVALVEIAIQPVWDGVTEHKWTDEQLSTLEKEFKRLDFLADYRTGMYGERTCAVRNIDYVRRTRVLVARIIPSGWFYENELTCASFETKWLLPLADVQHRTVSPAAASRAEAALKAEIRHRGIYNFFERLFLPGVAKVVMRFAYSQAGVDLARVACALERYHLAHDHYPKTLEALAPTFLGKVPHDVTTGQPLQYRRTGGGHFTLYSIGWDQSDDGGKIVMEQGSNPRVETASRRIDISKGDWVWPSRKPANARVADR